MRKKFVKVMFFGALAFTMTTAVTSCQDYDDDINNLQKQIDGINGITPVSTEALNSAIANAKSELQQEVERLEGLLADKAAQDNLEAEIDRLEGLIGEAVDQDELAGQLNGLREELQAQLDMKAAKEDMEAEIDRLEGLIGNAVTGEQLALELDKLEGNLSGQIADKATKEELNAAIEAVKESIKDVVSGSKLTEELGKLENTLTELINKKADDSYVKELENRIQQLENQLNGTDLVKTLADLKNQLAELEKAKADADYVSKLEQRIADLESAETTLAKLIEAEKKFQANGDLSGYYDSAFDQLINKRIIDALAEDGKIATYVTNAVNTALTNQLNTINNKVAAQTGNTIASLEEFVGKVYKEIYAANTGILDRLNQLETYSQAVDAFIKANNAQYEDYADVLAQIERTRQELAAISATPGGDLTDAIKTIVDGVLNEADGTLANLEKTLSEEITALKGLIQSIVYIPSTLDRCLNFSTLYAQKTNGGAYEVAARNESTGKLQFRISPASAITSLEDFNKKYNFSLIAEEKPEWSRAAGEEPFEIKATGYENGVLTLELTANDEQNYAVALSLTSKVAEPDKGLAATDITSDYLAIVQNSYYLTKAYLDYDATNVPASSIIYNDPKAADFSGRGTLKISYKTKNDASAPEVSNVKYSDLKMENIFSIEYSLDGTDKDLFTISQDGNVNLKSENQGIVAMIDKSADVYAKVKSDYYFDTPSTASASVKLGSVKIARLTKEMTHAYAAETKTWIPSTAQDITIDLNEAEVYQDLSVNISVSEYQALTPVPEEIETDVTKVRMVVTNEGSGNDLSVVIPAGTKAGDYETKVVLKKSDSTGDVYTVTVTKKITVEYPDVPELKFDPVLYNGTVNLSLTPTPDSEKPSDIITDYNLETVLVDYTGLESDVTAAGGTVVITVPNEDKFKGLEFNEISNTLTFDKTAFGKEDGTPADEVVKMKVEVKFGTETVQSIEAPIAIAKISGSWVAGPKAVSLTDKTATINLAKGFAWKDYRGYEMWKDGEAVTGGDHFAANTSGLSVYGLTAPTFAIVNEKGEPVLDKYLTVNAKGEVSFTDAGKAYSFVNDYSIRVKVSTAFQWGAISGYSESDNIITVTVKKEI